MQSSSSSSTSNDTKHGDDNTELSLAAQKEVWNLEQHIVASLVQVVDEKDDDDNNDEEYHESSSLFRILHDDDRNDNDSNETMELYGGVDVSYPKPVAGGDKNPEEEEEDSFAVAVYVILDKRRSLKVVYSDHEFFTTPKDIPYLPGYLAFREMEPLIRLIQRQQSTRPDFTPSIRAILVDGNGIFHPRHAGLACFVGTRIQNNIPTIGVGKSLLYEFGWTRDRLDLAIDTFLQAVVKELQQEENEERLMKNASSSSSFRRRGLLVPRSIAAPEEYIHKKKKLLLSSEQRIQLLSYLAPVCNGLAIPLKGNDRFPVIAYALIGHGGQAGAGVKPTKKVGSSKPIIVSVGHGLSMQHAVEIAASLSLAKVPEPIRQADLLGRRLLRESSSCNDKQKQT